MTQHPQHNEHIPHRPLNQPPAVPQQAQGPTQQPEHTLAPPTPQSESVQAYSSSLEHRSLEHRWASEHQLEPVDQELREKFNAVHTQVAKAVVGQSGAVEGIVNALLCSGHVLLEGVPGVAKTLLVRSISLALALNSSRIQFTPDLMPGDVTGSMMYNTQDSSFEFRPGPIFTNILLADEINRTPPKTQSALLEAMEEFQTSVDGTTHSLPSPFLVAATQNPVEYEGTYPLPEAQLDRFLFKLNLDLPNHQTEVEILNRHAAGFKARKLEESGIVSVLGTEDILRARDRITRVHCAPEVLNYIVDLVQATRQAPSLSIGVSPRGATRLLGATQARAWLHGRAFITPDDVKALVFPTFSHRVSLRPEAQMDGIGVGQVLESIVGSVAVPR